ncbi:hypothetical protein AAHE18_13G111400 [Arachis hypogaea]
MPLRRKFGFSNSSFSCLISLSIAVTSFMAGLSSGKDSHVREPPLQDFEASQGSLFHIALSDSGQGLM